MKRDFYDDCVEAVISHHEKRMVAIGEEVIFRLNTIDGKAVEGKITDLTPNLVTMETIKTGEGKSKRTVFIRRELIVSGTLGYTVDGKVI